MRTTQDKVDNERVDTLVSELSSDETVSDVIKPSPLFQEQHSVPSNPPQLLGVTALSNDCLSGAKDLTPQPLLIQIDEVRKSVTEKPEELQYLGQAIEEAVRMANKALSDALIYAHNAGIRLLVAKESCVYGEWGEWLKSNTKISVRTAQVYMDIAENWPYLERRMADNSVDMSINKATKLLAAKRKEEKGVAEGNGVEIPPKSKPYKVTIDEKERLPVLKAIATADDNVFEQIRQILILHNALVE